MHAIVRIQVLSYVTFTRVFIRSRKSEVIGMDLNPDSVAIAQTLVEECGMDDQITIQQADVLKVTLPQFDLGVTETFNAGLLFEPGHKITAALARSCRRILPSKAISTQTENRS